MNERSLKYYKYVSADLSSEVDLLKSKLRETEEELVLHKQEISNLLDFTIEAILEKYIKTFSKKDLFLDTEMITIRSFLKNVFGRDVV